MLSQMLINVSSTESPINLKLCLGECPYSGLRDFFEKKVRRKAAVGVAGNSFLLQSAKSIFIALPFVQFALRIAAKRRKKRSLRASENLPSSCRDNLSDRQPPYSFHQRSVLRAGIPPPIRLHSDGFELCKIL